KKETNTMNKYADDIRDKLHFVKYAPVLFTSAITKKRLFNVFDVLNSAVEENNRRVTTGLLNQIINEAVALNPAPTDKGRSPRIYYSTQAAVKPPTFVMFANNAELFRDSYKRYLENKIREAFSFSGTPIRLVMRNREKA
ncbi:MAG: ribosome-associated GTPase EngA, partial [Candidatus Sericytochromatia bacterium]